MDITIKDIDVKDIMSKTNLPISDFAVNPYVGCFHACKYYDLYRQIYTKKDRTNWSELDGQLRTYCETNGLRYVRNDDTVRARHGELPVVANYFYHEQIIPSARKGK